VQLDETIFARRSVVTTAALAVPFLLCASLAGAGRPVPHASAVVGLVLVIVAAAATGLRSAALLAAVSSALSFDFFLTRPYASLSIDSAEDVQVAVLLLLVGFAVTELALWGQRQRTELGRERGYLDGVMATAESVVGRRGDPDGVTRAVAARIRDVLRLDTCDYHPSTTLPGGPVLGRDGAVTRGGNVLDVDRSGLPTDEVVLLPVHAGGRQRGYFTLTAAARLSRPSVQQRRVAVLLADQLSALLDDTSSRGQGAVTGNR
jgi:K+-sensing histidine kinase KdpD